LKHWITLYILLLCAVSSLIANLVQAAPTTPTVRSVERARITTSFDADWRFFKGDAPDAQQPTFNDAAWRTLNVPHDWSIEGPFDRNNPTGRGGGYLPAGVGWYRKNFTLPMNYAQRHVLIAFDGVMADSEVWINGFHLGKRPYGYVSFEYDLTSHLKFGNNQTNVLAVRADNSAQPASRWYTGAGIYRHVRLIATQPLHLNQWSTFITTPQATASHATVHVHTTVTNQSNAARDVALQISLLSPNGQAVQNVETKPQRMLVGQSADFQQDIVVANPQLWNLDQPYLYQAVTRVRVGNTVVDDEVTPFGIREFHFDATTGFWLNGKNMKLQGVCLHHDAGGLGAAVPLGVWQRRFALLKQFGVNAIRTSHNPPAPEFLDLADRMGLLVMEETFDAWTVGKGNADYGYQRYFKDWWRTDTSDTIRRDRNRPSIVIYSVGNEIRDDLNSPEGFAIFTAQRDLIHQLDPSRPVTMAVFRPNQSHVYDSGFAELMDVVGQNYRESELIAAHQAKPTRKVIGTENGHDRATWLALRAHPFYAGQFLWTGFDYLGESVWPNVVSGSGLFDRTGVPRPRAYERQSWWTTQPMAHITRRVAPTDAAFTDPGYEPTPQRQRQALFSDWTPRNTKPHNENVEVYSNCEEVELLLNGKSLGSKPRPADASPRTWSVPFEAGTIQAVARHRGQTVATHELHTAGKPTKIVLSTDQLKLTPQWDDVAYVTASVVDEHGVVCPQADDLITFQLTGPGTIAAVDNGDTASHETFQASQRHAYQGQCIAIIKATAPTQRITLMATAPGLNSSSLTITPSPISETDGAITSEALLTEQGNLTR